MKAAIALISLTVLFSAQGGKYVMCNYLHISTGKSLFTMDSNSTVLQAVPFVISGLWIYSKPFTYVVAILFTVYCTQIGII
jgi:hypothetical protein